MHPPHQVIPCPAPGLCRVLTRETAFTRRNPSTLDFQDTRGSWEIHILSESPNLWYSVTATTKWTKSPRKPSSGRLEIPAYLSLGRLCRLVWLLWGSSWPTSFASIAISSFCRGWCAPWKLSYSALLLQTLHGTGSFMNLLPSPALTTEPRI